MTSAWGAVPFAVHVSDGVLAWPWVVGGFVVAGLLALLGAFRIRDEEIPRVALMTAAFFVASLIHVKLGPTSVHLLLNGLLGVVLGRRAPLAILVGVGLQALLLGHGGVSTIGVNACVMTIPALLAGWLFAALARERWMRHAWFRFALGCLVGALAVLATTALNAAVLIWGAAEDVRAAAVLVFLAHLPIVVIEGVVLGFAVGFLARVKPEMLGGLSWRPDFCRALRHEPPPANGAAPAAAPPASDAVQPEAPAGVRRPPALLLAVFGVFGAAGSAEAHRIDSQCFLLPDKRHVQVESWFSDGSKPQGAKVQVLRPNGVALADGVTNDQGVFVFGFDEAEDLTVVVDAGAGHRKEVVLPKAKLGRPPEAKDQSPGDIAGRRDDPPALPTPLVEHGPELPYTGVIAGVGFLLALAAFVISLRTMRQLQDLKRRVDAHPAETDDFISPPGIRLPAAPPTDPGRR
jgi:cobalt/nickel transport system permease protein